jgi:hypothetical protein
VKLYVIFKIWIRSNQAQRFMPIVPATQEAEIRRTTVPGQSGEKVTKILSQQTN